MSSIRWNATARYGAPGLLAGLMLAWALGMGRAPEVRADPQRSVDPSTGTIAFTSPGPNSSQFLFLIDTRNQAFAVYRVEPQEGKGAVKLQAARQYRYDLKLTEYNNLPPDVAGIESMVRSAK
jgi:hypothetical protein